MTLEKDAFLYPIQAPQKGTPPVRLSTALAAAVGLVFAAGIGITAVKDSVRKPAATPTLSQSANDLTP
jgi:hypothetical protein